MPGYVKNIEKITEGNKNFRRVLFTAKYCQLVVMGLRPVRTSAWKSTTPWTSSSGSNPEKGKVVMDGQASKFGPGFAIIVPAGTEHNVIAKTAVKLYTIYSPPNHPPDRLQKTKAQAMAEED